ncbi:hypothetical protein [Psychromonas antarctica]|uniref:hypothetical protein n=1 Tax=Psychromonas antarctica TaxID=67573 RepID=UPI001EE7F38C|nr:hypothetical protein [Psychromonas antarctica]MCG6202272.1 hypothetical protein [Psychromonas antarctica]
MNIITILVGIMIFASIVTGILYVTFGQVTVRKLRKNPETINALGSEFVSGWDILNVAKALSLPRNWSKKLENSPFSFLYANSNLIFKHTTKFDHFLGAMFFWCWLITGFFGCLLVVLNTFGVFAK